MAQKIRSNVRRYPNGWGEAAPLTGLLYCADCGGKMYVHRTNNGRRISQYSNHTDVFDIMELDYLRAINSSLFFINKLRNVNSSKLKDSDELTIKVWGEYSKQVNKLIDNLHDLIIKWNCDGLTNIKLK